MDNKLKEVMEDLDEVMALIKKLGEATPDNVDSLREDIKFTHNKIKGFKTVILTILNILSKLNGKSNGVRKKLNPKDICLRILKVS